MALQAYRPGRPLVHPPLPSAIASHPNPPPSVAPCCCHLLVDELALLRQSLVHLQQLIEQAASKTKPVKRSLDPQVQELSQPKRLRFRHEPHEHLAVLSLCSMSWIKHNSGFMNLRASNQHAHSLYFTSLLDLWMWNLPSDEEWFRQFELQLQSDSLGRNLFFKWTPWSDCAKQYGSINERKPPQFIQLWATSNQSNRKRLPALINCQKWIKAAGGQRLKDWNFDFAAPHNQLQAQEDDCNLKVCSICRSPLPWNWKTDSSVDANHRCSTAHTSGFSEFSDLGGWLKQQSLLLCSANIESYSTIQPVGEGSYGKVSLVKAQDGRQFAAKTFHLNQSNEEILEELECLHRLRTAGAAHCVRLVAVEYTCHRTTMLTEYVECGRKSNKNLSFQDLIDQTSWGERQMYMKQLFEGLKEIHSCGIVHHDIKPSNILCSFDPEKKDREFTLKICDFGLSSIQDKGYQYDHYGGTTGFKSPEKLMQAGRIDSSSDIWSAGIILLSFIMGNSHIVSRACGKGATAKSIGDLRMRKDCQASLFQLLVLLGAPLQSDRLREKLLHMVPPFSLCTPQVKFPPPADHDQWQVTKASNTIAASKERQEAVKTVRDIYSNSRKSMEAFIAPRCSQVTEALLVSLFNCPRSAAALAVKCLAWNSPDRPTAEQAIKQEFFYSRLN
jgi:serine/threonine protein kinase